MFSIKEARRTQHSNDLKAFFCYYVYILAITIYSQYTDAKARRIWKSLITWGCDRMTLHGRRCNELVVCIWNKQSFVQQTTAHCPYFTWDPSERSVVAASRFVLPMVLDKELDRAVNSLSSNRSKEWIRTQLIHPCAVTQKRFGSVNHRDRAHVNNIDWQVCSNTSLEWKKPLSPIQQSGRCE